MDAGAEVKGGFLEEGALGGDLRIPPARPRSQDQPHLKPKGRQVR